MAHKFQSSPTGVGECSAHADGHSTVPGAFQSSPTGVGECSGWSYVVRALFHGSARISDQLWGVIARAGAIMVIDTYTAPAR